MSKHRRNVCCKGKGWMWLTLELVELGLGQRLGETRRKQWKVSWVGWVRRIIDRLVGKHFNGVVCSWIMST